MRELPKELTAGLLSLVLDKEVKENSLFIRDGYLNYYALSEKLEASAFRECSLNIDTLTRLMKEWVVNQKETIYVDIAEGVKAEVVEISIAIRGKTYSKRLYKKMLDFEDVISYTHWVAKEKGLI